MILQHKNTCHEIFVWCGISPNIDLPCDTFKPIATQYPSQVINNEYYDIAKLYAKILVYVQHLHPASS